MKVHSVFVDSMANTPEDPADRISAMKDAITGSASYLPSGTPFIIITGIAPNSNFRHANERTIEALKELGEHAARHEMRIAFEPLSPVNIHTDTSLWYLDQGIELVDRVSHPAVGICIDTWNVWQTPKLDDVIRQCGNRIFLVQLSDWKTPRSTADRYSLGDGEIPLNRIVASIRETGFEGAWVVEILSSYHLPGSLWKENLDDLLERNYRRFTNLFEIARRSDYCDGVSSMTQKPPPSISRAKPLRSCRSVTSPAVHSPRKLLYERVAYLAPSPLTNRTEVVIVRSAVFPTKMTSCCSRSNAMAAMSPSGDIRYSSVTSRS